MAEQLALGTTVNSKQRLLQLLVYFLSEGQGVDTYIQVGSSHLSLPSLPLHPRTHTQLPLGLMDCRHPPSQVHVTPGVEISNALSAFVFGLMQVIGG